MQIYQEAKKFGKVYNIQVCCCYGGGSKWEQSKALESGAEIVVATPGRMIDLVKMKATNLTRVTFLVLDEADRMFNMGFGNFESSIESKLLKQRFLYFYFLCCILLFRASGAIDLQSRKARQTNTTVQCDIQKENRKTGERRAD